MSLEDAKGQCRVDLDFTDDDRNLLRYIKAARELAEVNTRRTFCATVYVMTLDAFPVAEGSGWPDRITLPTAPVIELRALSYLDLGRNRVTIDLSVDNGLQIGLDDEPPWIGPAAFSYWPANFRAQGGVSVEYLAGYASTAGSPATLDDIPARAQQAMLMLIAHWYENREDVVAETRIIPTKIQRGFDELLDGLILNL